MKEHIIDVVFVLEDLVTSVRTLNDTLLEFSEKYKKNKETKGDKPVVGSTSVTYTSLFNAWWSTYPKLPRTGKIKTFQYWRKLFGHSPSEEILKEITMATENYASHIVLQGRLARDPERFLQDNWWKGWLDDGSYESSNTTGTDEKCSDRKVDSTNMEQGIT